MNSQNLEAFKKILEKHGYSCSEDELLAIAAWVEELASAITKFESKKNESER